MWRATLRRHVAWAAIALRTMRGRRAAWTAYRTLWRLNRGARNHTRGGTVAAELAGLTFHGFGYPHLLHLYREVFLEQDYAVDLATDRPTIIDCGSNIGISIAYFKRRYPASRVIGFEPHPQLFSLLRRNLEGNGMTDVEVHECALGGTAGPVTLFASDDPGSLRSSVRSDRGGAIPIGVGMERLSDHLVRLETVDLVKIDVEGAERDILEDLVQAGLFNRPRAYIVEYHLNIGSDRSDLSSVLRMFEEHGFDYQIQARRQRHGRFQDVLIHACRAGSGIGHEAACARSSFLVRTDDARYAVEIRRAGGHLDHYYHFIMDFLWPLHHWIEEHVGWERVKDIQALEPRSRYFGGHFRSILSVRLSGIGRWVRMRRLLQTASPIQLRGFDSERRDYFRTLSGPEDLRRSRASLVARTVRSCASQEVVREQPLVVLIERVAAPDDRGATRRQLRDHGALAATLARRCQALGVRFLNARLEQMTFAEQFRLMRSGPTVLIGQHGAGLLSGLWMSEESGAVIELASQDNPAHFANLYTDLRVPYERVLCRSTQRLGGRQELRVDADAVGAALDSMLPRPRVRR